MRNSDFDSSKWPALTQLCFIISMHKTQSFCGLMQAASRSLASSTSMTDLGFYDHSISSLQNAPLPSRIMTPTMGTFLPLSEHRNNGDTISRPPSPWSWSSMTIRISSTSQTTNYLPEDRPGRWKSYPVNSVWSNTWNAERACPIDH